jgi:hypothetical protein
MEYEDLVDELLLDEESDQDEADAARQAGDSPPALTSMPDLE